MATPLTERNLSLCIGCISCTGGNRCRRIYGNKFKIKFRSPAFSWTSYYQKNKADLLKKRRDHRKNNLIAARVSEEFTNYFRESKMNRPEECQECGHKVKYIIAHHEDYSDPYAIHWLCNSCHKKVYNGSLMLVSEPIKY